MQVSPEILEALPCLKIGTRDHLVRRLTWLPTQLQALAIAEPSKDLDWDDCPEMIAVHTLKIMFCMDFTSLPSLISPKFPNLERVVIEDGSTVCDAERLEEVLVDMQSLHRLREVEVRTDVEVGSESDLPLPDFNGHPDCRVLLDYWFFWLENVTFPCFSMPSGLSHHLRQFFCHYIYGKNGVGSGGNARGRGNLRFSLAVFSSCKHLEGIHIDFLWLDDRLCRDISVTDFNELPSACKSVVIESQPFSVHGNCRPSVQPSDCWRVISKQQLDRHGDEISRIECDRIV